MRYPRRRTFDKTRTRTEREKGDPMERRTVLLILLFLLATAGSLYALHSYFTGIVIYRQMYSTRHET